MSGAIPGPIRPPARHRWLARWHAAREHPAKLRLLRWTKRLLQVDDLMIQVAGGSVMLLDERDYVQHEILSHGAYEPQTLALVARLCEPGMTFLDVGAHVGQFALRASAAVGPSGRVYCLEPNPRTAARLLTNIRLNRRENIRVAVCGLSDRTGFAYLHQPHEHNWGGAAVTGGFEAGSPAIATARAGDLAAFFGWERLDVVKVDVEGHELNVLRSILAPGSPRPTHLVLEHCPQLFGQQDVAAVPRLLAAAGYRLCDIRGTEYRPGCELPEMNLWAQRT